MDKTVYINTNVKERRGFVLMITLSVLAVIIALTMILLGYFEEAREDATETKALIQANVHYANITKIFKKFKNQKQLFSLLYKSSLPLRTPDGRFSLILDCKPSSEGININWLGFEKDRKRTHLYTVAQELFDILSQNYKLEDPSRLHEMLLEAILGKGESVGARESRLVEKTKIISYLQFSDIIKRYQFEVDDEKIGKVPWRKYFSFSPTAETIDIEYSSALLISYLFEIELSSVREWYNSIVKIPIATMVQDNGGDYNSRKNILSKDSYLSGAECSVNFSLSGEYYRFRFEYNKGEAKHFEFFGKR